MNIRKIFSAVLTAAGILLLAGTAALSLKALDTPVQLLGQTPQAQLKTEQWAQALEQGDYDALGRLMYGEPSLAADRESAYAVGDLIWEAFVHSFSCEFGGDCRASEQGLSRDVTIQALDIAAVMDQVETELDPLITRRAEALDADVVFDENNGYREEFVMDSLRETVEIVLDRELPYARVSLTLELVYEDGQWWILPRQALIDILSGKLGKGV